MRQQHYTRDQAVKLFIELGLAGAYVQEMLDGSAAKLKELQDEAKKAYKQKAFELHPDHNNGEDEEFKRLQGIYAVIKSLKPSLPVHRSSVTCEPGPRKSIIVNVVFNFTNIAGVSNATTSGTTGSWY